MNNILKRGVNKSQRLLIDSLFTIKCENLLFKNKKGAKILCYHGIDLIENKQLNMRFYSVESLEKHFYYFKKYFNPISVSDFFNNNFDASRFNIAITFDDGYRNNFKYLLPLAEKYKIPVSIYITGINNTEYDFLWSDFADIVSFYSKKEQIQVSERTFLKKQGKYIDDNGVSIKNFIKQKGDLKTKKEFIECFPEFKDLCSTHNLEDYWKLMSDDEIIEASKSKYISIGSHAYYHNNLDNIPLEEATNEMSLSKIYLESLIQKPVKEIAYPDGAYSRNVISKAEQLGYKYQLAVNYKHKEDESDNRIMDRFGMYPVYSNNYQILQIVK